MSIIILDRDETKLMVENEPTGRGKYINCFATIENGIMDNFRVGVSWNSIEKLKKKATKNVFEWKIKDKSLTINSKNNKWKCIFRSRPVSFNLLLTEEETEKIKEVLFD